MADELISLNVWLAGRSYRIRVSPAEEQAVRLAVKEADEKVREFKVQYAGKDDQDFIAMCLLVYATNSVNNAATSPAVKQEITLLMDKIDKALEEKKD